jgi:hypothetical protein
VDHQKTGSATIAKSPLTEFELLLQSLQVSAMVVDDEGVEDPVHENAIKAVT